VFCETKISFCTCFCYACVVKICVCVLLTDVLIIVAKDVVFSVKLNPPLGALATAVKIVVELG
jgi:hypothetical protein